MHEDAARAYSQAVRLDPGDPAGYTNLGDALFEMNQDDESETAYRDAVRADPYDPVANSKLGEFLQATGRRKEGAAQLRESRRLQVPRLADARQSRASRGTGSGCSLAA